MVKKLFTSATLAATLLVWGGGEMLRAQAGGAAPSKPVAAQQQSVLPAGNAGGTANAGPTGVSVSANTSKYPDVDERTYVLGPEDQIQVVVFNDEQLSGTFLVRPDGRISMSLIDEVKVEGKTPLEVQAEIVERLKAGDYINSPRVSVRVLDPKSQSYALSGEVGTIGPVPLLHPTTVFDALARAGFKEFANKKNIQIMRKRPDGSLEKFKFNWNEVLKNKNVQQNIYLKPGDIIYVP
jgi:polysaccharide export outer membrane protein